MVPFTNIISNNCCKKRSEEILKCLPTSMSLAPRAIGFMFSVVSLSQMQKKKDNLISFQLSVINQIDKIDAKPFKGTKATHYVNTKRVPAIL